MELKTFISIVKKLVNPSSFSTVFSITESHITYTNGFLLLQSIHKTGLTPGIYSLDTLMPSAIKYPNCEQLLAQTGESSAALDTMLDIAQLIKPISKKPIVVDFLGRVGRLGDVEGLNLEYLNIAAKLELNEAKLGKDGFCMFEATGIKLILCTTRGK